MKPALRVMLCDDAGERFFGEGPCRLLHLIEETGSLRSAAAQMGLSYSKALRLVQHAEIFIRVLLPEPDSPTIAMNSPGHTVKSKMCDGPCRISLSEIRQSPCPSPKNKKPHFQ